VSETFALQVNGAHRAVSAEPDTPLVYLLRNDLGLKGTRFGCGTGHCGACTVLMDGNAVQSCDTPLWSAAGRAITTIEGLGSAAHPHPLQQAFLDEQAAQCGYCISGIVMSAAALLEHNRDPSDAEIAAALDRHLCRCGTHVRILRAIKRAAAVLREVPAR
jgi:nicotinate dehydrogenase subunit A